MARSALCLTLCAALAVVLAQGKDAMWALTPEAIAEAKGGFWNWADKGVITKVNPFEECGDGPPQGVADSIAAQRAIAGGPLVKLSYQELLACAKPPFAYGCDGSIPSKLFEWTLNKTGGGGGLTTEKNYPYRGPIGPKAYCNYTKVKQIETHFKNFTILDGRTDEELASWVRHNGPIVAGVDALDWYRNYTAGFIIETCDKMQIDKGVLITGYNDNNSPPYWIIKMNFGVEFGNEGYIWMKKGDPEICGIGKYVSAANPIPKLT